jgi:hypothetical protein
MMKRKIKMALCFRVVVLLIGPGLHCLFANIFIVSENKGAAPSNDGKYSKTMFRSMQ